MPRRTQQTLLLLLLAVVCGAATAATSASRATPAPPPAPPLDLHELECAAHQLAFEYGKARTATNWASLQAALRLDNCTSRLSSIQPQPSRLRPLQPLTPPEATSAPTYFVSTTGSDSNPGTLTSPFRTLEKARDTLRSRAGGPAPATVFLRAGIFYLNQTFELDERDSFTAYAAYNNETVVLSGAFLVAGASWTPYKGGPIMQTRVTLPPSATACNGDGGDDDNDDCALETGVDFSGHDVDTRAMATSAAECCTICAANPACKFFTYETQTHHCWQKSSDAGRRPYTDHISGRPGGGPPPPPPPPPPAHVYGPPPERFTSLFVDGLRMVRARYPNGNPQTTSGKCFSKPQFPGEGCSSYLQAEGGSGTLPAPPASAEVATGPNRGASPTKGCLQCLTYGSFKYSIYPFPPNHPVYNKPLPGMGWSNNSLFSFWGSPFSRPASFKSSQAAARNWSQPDTGVVHMFHSGLWGGWQFRLTGVDRSSSTLQLGYGGYQEARGSGIKSNAFYVENIFEELDSPGEWFLDTNTSTLYIYPNSSAGIGSSQVALAHLDTVVRIQGRAAGGSYAQNITLSGLTFAQTRATFLDAYEVPSGGDWSIHRGGAVFVEDAEGITVQACTFNQTGGNALFFSNHVHESLVLRNEFQWTGDSAIAFVGQTDGINATQPTFPFANTVQNNHIHDTGIYGMQTSAFCQSLAAATRLIDNVAYNGPRAAVNVNDGMYGANWFQGNLLFNAVQQTGDHGPYNSWDRQPYYVKNGVDDGFHIAEGVSIIKANDIITKNLILNGYNGVWCIDHDDGSQFMNDTSNAMFFGGCKNYLGNSKSCNDNVIVHPGLAERSSGNRRCQTDDNGVFANQFHEGNRCMTQDGDFYTWGGHCGVPSISATVYHTERNQLFSPNKAFSLPCGKTTFSSLADWQSKGQDSGSSISEMPATAEIIAMAQDVLK